MATFELTDDNIAASIADNEILVIDFWAEWCGPCKKFAPVFEVASEKYPDIGFAKCDTEAQQALAGQFGIRAIPTLAIFRGGINVFQQPGMLPAEAIDDLLRQVQELDMEHLKQLREEEMAKNDASVEG